MTSADALLLHHHGGEPDCVQVRSPFPGCIELSLRRPDQRNALNENLIGELTTLLHLASSQLDEDACRVVHLKGEGSVFCAGADLAMMKELGQAGYEANVADAKRLARLFRVLSEVPCPVICSVQGAAIGGGFGLAICADLVLSHEEAVFSTSEVRLGLVPSVISPYIVRKIGLSASSAPLLSGQRLSGRRAHEMGLIYDLASAKEGLGALAETWIQQFLSCAPGAQRETKRLLQLASPLPSDEVVAETVRTIARVREGHEAQYGLECFLKKTPAQWSSYRSGRREKEQG